MVLGNGGGDFWAAFKRHAARNPGWRERENPLDDFTRDVVEREVTVPLRDAALRYTIIHPFMSNGPTLDFVALGKAAEIAGPSILGVVVHPRFGPWIAFRAALLLDIEVEAPGEARGFDPCPGCVPRSCLSACPVGAVSFPRRMGRAEVSDASGRGRARLRGTMPRAGRMCDRSGASAIPTDELAYHQMRALRAMRPYYETQIRPKPRG